MGGVGIMDGQHQHVHPNEEAKANCKGNEGVEILVLRASVEDTGLGMTDDEQKWLFKRFSQTSKKISATYGGSGLGLNICYELVKLLGGEITVRSSKDVGTSFEFTVRLTRPSACEVQDYGRLHVPMATLHEKSLGRFGRVLIAEDNAINQKIMAKYMTQLELEYTIVDNGLKAVEAYTTLDANVKPFDFVIMDMEMPVLDGRQATVAIREWEKKNARKRVPIVALSGNARKEQVEHAFGCGVDDYLTKPCKLDGLRSMVQKWQGVEGAVNQSS
ncbi:CheY-like protein [Saitoella complicata NRRL Y-17804]|uniref:CheY-like protein n=1 Tax=Saitoella complicata (strain BCRC 22490 / CBS 7301 / JCM 7358 / NBRC 10748 / NRRL Y-17804) TaxID=698492 RepID=UPI0008682744|nr:CheY-like protein [Saitoella complicata NRRL Y-17804]ODQ49600.1 CheY-like protein [Saitoella complicata NRRL Y-17804]